MSVHEVNKNSMRAADEKQVISSHLVVALGKMYKFYDAKLMVTRFCQTFVVYGSCHNLQVFYSINAG